MKSSSFFKEDNEMPTETTSGLQEKNDEFIVIIQKQNRLIRFQSIVQSLILILLIGISVFAASFFLRVQNTIDTVDAKLEEVDVETLNLSIAALDEAAGKLDGLDAATINDSVKALNEAAENLSKIDTEQINALAESLTTSAESLEEVTKTLSDLFA